MERTLRCLFCGEGQNVGVGLMWDFRSFLGHRRTSGWIVAILGAWFVYGINSLIFSDVTAIWFLVSIGPTFALVLHMPESVMSRNRAVIGGHLISALVGVLCAKLIASPTLAAGIAIGVSMGLMAATHCDHPAGTATALIPVLGGPEVQALGWWYVMMPVATNVAALLAFTAAYRAIGGIISTPRANRLEDT